MSRIFRHRRLVIAGAAAAALLAAAAAFALVASRGSSGGSSGSASVAAAPPSTRSLQAGATNDGASSSVNSTAGGSAWEGTAAPRSNPISSDVSPLDPQRFLVRTGEMSVTVAKGGVPQAAAQVVALTSAYGGYVLNSQVSSAAGSSPPFADITVRVPARLYDVAIRRFGALGDMQSVQTSATDVTGRYVDLQARLAQARSVNRRLLGFLARTSTVTEALAVQARIDATQLRVEQLAGQLKALGQQVTYGTLAVSISEHATHHAAHHRSGFVAALSSSWRHLVAGFEAILVGLGAIIPFALLLAVLAIAAWFGARATVHLRHRVRLEQ